MSLQLAAKHLAAKGRGPDTQLVHMSMDEVRSLHELAKAHGGAITINPDTGLPEAGFLSKILPMVAGAALMATGIGAPAAAMLVGGGMTAATGSLQKGLMAGLGAYGGAGLGAGLMGAGGAGASVADAAQFGINAGSAAPGVQAGFSQMGQGISALGSEAGRNAFMTGVGGSKGLMQAGMAGLAPMMMGEEQNYSQPAIKTTTPTPPMQFNPGRVGPTPSPDVPGYGDQGQNFGREQRYFNPGFSPMTPMPMMAGGGPVEAMSDANAVGANTGYPMANISRGAYATPYQQPIPQNVITGSQDTNVNPYTGEERLAGGGGISDLGSYSDGGRLLRGPGDGVSDSIPAMIGRKQPARLADGEFVVPARIVSELGNGSTEAGARKLYAMMDRVQRARGKTVGKGRVAKNSRADRYLPA